MQNTLPLANAEEVKAAAVQAMGFAEAASATINIMKMAFPDFDQSRTGIDRMLLGNFVSDQLANRGMPALSADDVHFLNGPIICHSGHGGWGPEWDGHPVHQRRFKDQIREERIEAALGLSPFSVGPTELMCVMYAATADAPMSHDLTELYIWASAKAMDRCTGMGAGHTYSALGDNAGGPRHLTDDDVLTKEPWRTLYRSLADSVRQKVTAHQRGRVKVPRKAKAEDAETWWRGADIATRIDFLEKHDLDVAHSASDQPDRAVLQARFAELV